MSGEGNPAPTQAVLAVARGLAADGVTAEAVREMRAEEVRTVLLKGPAIAEWLYGDGTRRDYVDVDLLVAPDSIGAAERVLTRMGFRPLPREPGSDHARAWGRPGAAGGQVDLHHTLFGVGVPPRAAWRALEGETETMAVAGTTVDVLSPRARALLVALHAMQHGREVRQPLEDLRRAVDLLPEGLWASTSELAATLHASHALAAGLRLEESGDRLADRLGLPSRELVEAVAAGDGRGELAAGIERLASTPGWRRKLALLARELVPSPEYLRWRFPLARRGGVGLAASYLWRPFWLLRRLPSSIAVWRRQRRAGA